MRPDGKFWEARWREAADQREQYQAERDAARATLADERAKALVRHLAKMEEFDEALDAARAEVRERIAEQVTTLAPDESGRISKGLVLAYILGELDATIALLEEKP